MKLSIKWGSKNFELDVADDATYEVLRAQLQSLTNVPAPNQKILGIKAGASDDMKLSDLGIKDGKKLLLIGASAESLFDADSAKIIHFEEEAVGGLVSSSRRSNGIFNIGNTCYYASAIQLLRIVPQAVDLLSQSTSKAAKSLSEFCKRLDSTANSETPQLAWMSFIAENPAFAKREKGMLLQHDSHEALAIYLNHIAVAGEGSTHQALFSMQLTETRTLIPAEAGDGPDAQGILERAAAEATPSVEACSYCLLSFAGDSTTVYGMLNSSFENEITMNCAALGRDAKFLVQRRFSRLPEYLCLTLGRFSWRSDIADRVKICKPVPIPFHLDVFKLCTSELQAAMLPERTRLLQARDAARLGAKEEDTVPSEQAEAAATGNTNGFYELCGIISHKGQSAHSGHYVAWTKRTDTWFMYDDDRACSVSIDNIRSLSGTPQSHVAYILLFRSRNPATNKPALDS